MVRKKQISDWVFDIINVFVMLLLVVVTLYPFINSAAISFNDANDTTRGGLTFYPRVPTLRNYQLIDRFHLTDHRHQDAQLMHGSAPSSGTCCGFP